MDGNNELNLEEILESHNMLMDDELDLSKSGTNEISIERENDPHWKSFS